MKRPSFQFYPGDWMQDAALRTVSVAARGLWIDMICIMHQGSPYGHLKVNSKAICEVSLSRLVGANSGEVKDWLNELETSGVFQRDSLGTIYSKRMVADEALRNVRADGGSKGGNPDLGVNYNIPGFVYLMSRTNGDFKIGVSVSPDKRAYRLRKSLADESVKVIAKHWVDDMGREEAALHERYAANRVGSTEWFRFADHEKTSVIDCVLHLKVNSKENQTPSSSSSSSSSSKEDIPASPDSRAKPRKTALPENFGISDRVKAWAAEKGHSRLAEHLESFKAKALAKGYAYVDWDSAFMEAIRENWAKITTSAPQDFGGSPASRRQLT